MKVLITTDWYKPAINGVVTSVCNLREELEQRGHEVKILTLSEEPREEVKRRTRAGRALAEEHSMQATGEKLYQIEKKLL